MSEKGQVWRDLYGVRASQLASEGWPKTRKEALDSGAAYYFTGVACKHGHIDLRIAKCGACMACARASSQRRNARKHLNKTSAIDSAKLDRELKESLKEVWDD